MGCFRLKYSQDEGWLCMKEKEGTPAHRLMEKWLDIFTAFHNNNAIPIFQKETLYGYCHRCRQ